MSSFFQALRNFRLHKYPPPPPPRDSSEYKDGIFLSHKFTEVKQENSSRISSQSSSSRARIGKDDVRKIIGKARLDSQKYGRFTFYLVKWKSKSWKESTWHHPQHLQNAVSRIVPFNVNIKDKPLPYFDPKYMVAQPNYQRILQEFVKQFLQTKRTQKVNSQSIRPETQNADRELSESFKRSSTQKAKKLKQKSQINYQRSRDIKITLTERIRQTSKKQQTKYFRNDYNHKKDSNERKKKNDRYNQQNKSYHQDKFYERDRYDRNFGCDRKGQQEKNEKNDRKSYWNRPETNRKSFDLRKDHNTKKQQTVKTNKELKDQLVNAAIRQCFHSKIQKSGSSKNHNIQEESIQFGEVLDSPQFSKSSDEIKYEDWTTTQKIENYDKFQRQDAQDLVFLSDTYHNENLDVKQQAQFESSNKNLEFIEIKPLKKQYQPESGEMILDEQTFLYSRFVQPEDGEITDINFTYFGRSLN